MVWTSWAIWVSLMGAVQIWLLRGGNCLIGVSWELDREGIWARKKMGRD